MSAGTFDTVGDSWKAVPGKVVVETDEAVESDPVVEEDTGRVTEKPASDEVDFTVIRAFTWHGTKFTVGEHTLPEEEYNGMMYDLNLRTDRQVFIAPE